MQPAATSQRVLIMLIGLILFAACTTTAKPTIQQDLSALQFKRMLEPQGSRGDVVLLDIRTPGEFNSGHIPGAVPLDYYARDFVDKLKALDRDKTYLVYCRSGNRSGNSLTVFDQLGFQKVYHLKTGIKGWQRENFPMTR